MCQVKTRLQEINASVSHKEDYKRELRLELLQLDNEIISLKEEGRLLLQEQKEPQDA